MQFHNSYVMRVFEMYFEKEKKFDCVMIAHLLYILEGMKNKCLAYSKVGFYQRNYELTLDQQSLLKEMQFRMQNRSEDNTINQVLEFEENLYRLHENISNAIRFKHAFLTEISKNFIDLYKVQKYGTQFIQMREVIDLQFALLYRKNQSNYLLQLLVQIYLASLSFSDSKIWFEKNRLGIVESEGAVLSKISQKDILFSKSSVAVFVSIQKEEFGTIQKVSKNIDPIFGYMKEEVLGQNVSVLLPINLAAHHNSLIQRFLQRGFILPELTERISPLIARKKSSFLLPIKIKLQVGYLNYEDIGVSSLITSQKSSNESFLSFDMQSKGFNLRLDGFTDNIFHQLLFPACNFSRIEEYKQIHISRIFPVLPFFIENRFKNNSAKVSYQSSERIEMIGFIPKNSQKLIGRQKKKYSLCKSLSEYRHKVIQLLEKKHFSSQKNILVYFSLTITYLREGRLEYCHIQINSFTEINSTEHSAKLLRYQLLQEFKEIAQIQFEEDDCEHLFTLEGIIPNKRLFQGNQLDFSKKTIYKKLFSGNSLVSPESQPTIKTQKTEKQSTELKYAEGSSRFQFSQSLLNEQQTKAGKCFINKNFNLNNTFNSQTQMNEFESANNVSLNYSIHPIKQQELNQILFTKTPVNPVLRIKELAQVKQTTFSSLKSQILSTTSLSSFGIQLKSVDSEYKKDNLDQQVAEVEYDDRQTIEKADDMDDSTQIINFNSNKIEMMQKTDQLLHEKNRKNASNTPKQFHFIARKQNEEHIKLGPSAQLQGIQLQTEQIFGTNETKLLTTQKNISILQEKSQIVPISSGLSQYDPTLMFPLISPTSPLTSPTVQSPHNILSEEERSLMGEQQVEKKSERNNGWNKQDNNKKINNPYLNKFSQAQNVKKKIEQISNSQAEEDSNSKISKDETSNDINLSNEIQSLKDLSLSSTSKGSYDKTLKKTIIQSIEKDSFSNLFMILKLLSILAFVGLCSMVVLTFINLAQDFQNQKQEFFYIPWGMKIRVAVSRILKDNAFINLIPYSTQMMGSIDSSAIKATLLKNKKQLDIQYNENYHLLIGEKREDLTLKNFILTNEMTQTLRSPSGFLTITNSTINYYLLRQQMNLFAVSYEVYDTMTLQEIQIINNFLNLTVSLQLSQIGQEQAVQKGFNKIQDRMTILLAVVSFVSGFFVLMSFAAFAYAQAKKERILKLFSSIEPQKILDMYQALLTSFDILFSGKSKYLLQVGQRQTVQKQRQDRLPPIMKKKKIITLTNQLPRTNISLIISGFFILGILLIYPIVNVITAISLINQSQSNQSLTGSFQTVKAQITSNLSAYVNYRLQSFTNGLSLLTTKTRMISLIASNPKLLSTFNSEMNMQQLASRYKSDLFNDFVFKSLKEDACLAFDKYFFSYNQQAANQFDNITCQSIFQSTFKLGMIQIIQKFFKIFEDLMQIDQLTDSARQSLQYQQYFTQMTLIEINNTYEIIALMFDTFTSFINTINVEFFDLMNTVQTWLMIFHFFVLILTYKFALLKFINYISSSLYQTKIILSIFEAKFLYENSYILNYLKQ